ncbi:AI-2 transport protein TqsA [Adhaeretor mobilis]|uniref:AI-2 transport protein TqsA n=2 Tax=Adhaeretor mobilis TaxID=1930276 RepID=A0A517MX59_9BACT|nr:AI-2 transport protein TqsA [Adhaeretor mobilis]
MWLIGLPNPILRGVGAALLNYFQFAGPAIGAIMVFVEGLGAFNGLAHAALAPAIYIGLNALEANCITHAMLGNSISLNPVMILQATVSWGWLWGIGGVLLSLPLLAVLKICFDHSRTLDPVGVFMER